jgi:CelD/BcsL family acetyltransferase involved in cellulose biosynthesis
MMTPKQHVYDDAVFAATAGVLAKATPVDSNMAVELVSDYEHLVGLRLEWEALLAKSGADHPFMSHDWICAWWESFGAGKILYVVLVRSAGNLIAAAPLMLSEERMFGLRMRRLGSIYNPHTPRFDFIVARGHDSAYSLVWEYLRSRNGDWDVLELCQLAAESSTCTRLESLAEADGYYSGYWDAPGSPYLPVSGGWDNYWQGLRAKHRSNLRNRSKRLDKLGRVELQIISGGPEVPAALDDGFRIEMAAWKGEAGTAMGVLPEVEHFYRGLAGRMARRGELHLQFLTVDGRRIAFGYSLRSHNRIYLLKPGYDPAYAQYSPVNLLCLLALRDAFEQGLTEYDFLGDNDPWKLEWTGRLRAHRWLFIFADNPRAVLLRNLKFRIFPFLKKAHGCCKHLILFFSACLFDSGG